MIAISSLVVSIPRCCASWYPRIDREATRLPARLARALLGPACSDGVPGGLGGVAAARRGGPAESSVGSPGHGPLGVLLHAVVVAALRIAVAQAGPAARFVRGG